MSFDHRDAGTPERAWRDAGVEGLPELDPGSVPGRGGRLVVVAAHPDDESLGAAGLIHAALRAGADVRVLLCSAGEASHPDSPTVSPTELAAIRLDEFSKAMRGLADAPDPGAGVLDWRHLGLPDGAVSAHLPALEAALAAELPAEGPAVIAAPYRFDGHADHDAVGAVAARVAARHGAGLLEFPIWYWLWATPGESDQWRHWRTLPLDGPAAAAKRAAMSAHGSQIRPLSGAEGDETLLTESFLEHFERPAETFRWSAAGRRDSGSAADVFDALYRRDPDPWAYLTSWYERRKRDVTLASLPRERYGAAAEAGCSIGVLTESLARRCDELTAIDASGVALELAARRLGPLGHVRLVRADLPGGWPAFDPGSLDLVVVSEIGYFLGGDELTLFLLRAARSLRPGGHLLLCHWLHPVAGWELDGEAVHAEARALEGWTPVVTHRERDFLLEVFEAPGEHAGDRP
ncbi:MAG: PIG-L family deacetylase [Arthrobacter sp.]|uniref:PIG-L family deacetylase n=1 Tax=Arthrobacter sp. TaxID=1667 RepID=UPI003478980A